MLIKAGVDISRLRPEVRKRLGNVARVIGDRNGELTITSTYEGNHGAGSLHYANAAIDIRYPPDKTKAIKPTLKKALGEDFDVVEELDHIHIEYDPK